MIPLAHPLSKPMSCSESVYLYKIVDNWCVRDLEVKIIYLDIINIQIVKCLR